MNIKIKVLFFLSTIFLFSCLSKEKSNSPLYNIDIRPALKSNELQFKLSEFGENIELVPLETNKNCLLTGISELVLTDEYIFASDREKLIQFGKKGNFMQQIGRTGKGPSEHGSSIKFNVNELTSEIFIFSNRHKITVHDLHTGQFKRSFNLPFLTSKFDFIQKDKCLFFTMEFSQKFDPSIIEMYITDSAGVIIDSIPDFKRLNNRNNVAGNVFFYRLNKHLNFMGYYKDTLYQLNDNLEKQSCVAFNLGNNVKWEDLNVEPEMNGRLNDFVGVSNALEDKNYFYLTLQMGIPSVGEERVFRTMLYNKKNRKLIPVKGLTDESNGGILFWPKFVSDGYLVDYYPAYKLLENIKSLNDASTISEDLKKIASILSEDDNPVLIMAKLN